MEKLEKKAKVSLIVVAVVVSISLVVGGVAVMRKKAEEYILREARIGLKIYFEKYYNGVDPNSIKMEIKYHHHMVSGPYIDAYVNNDKNLWIKCNVIRVPENKMNNRQDELGMVIADVGMSRGLVDMQKREYSVSYPNTKPIPAPSDLISKSEIEKAKKDRYLLDFIPEMMHY